MNHRVDKYWCQALTRLLICLAVVLSVTSVIVSQPRKPPSDFDLAVRAINKRDAATLKTLIEKDETLVLKKDERFGATLLHYAAVEKDLGIIELLVNKGAARYEMNNEDAIPLLLAVVPNPNVKLNAEQTRRIVEWLSPQVIDLPNVDGKTALHLAAEYGDEAMVSALLTAGANPNLQTITSKKRPLDYATNPQIRKLLGDTSSPKPAENFAALLLQYASEGNLEKLKDLVRRAGDKLNINSTNADGDTALILAAKKSHFKIVEFLIKRDANTSLPDAKNRTVWELLCPPKMP